MLYLTPDTARALREREALYTDGPEGRERGRAFDDCDHDECGACNAAPCACDADCDGAL